MPLLKEIYQQKKNKVFKIPFKETKKPNLSTTAGVNPLSSINSLLTSLHGSYDLNEEDINYERKYSPCLIYQLSCKFA